MMVKAMLQILLALVCIFCIAHDMSNAVKYFKKQDYWWFGFYISLVIAYSGLLFKLLLRY